MLSYPVKHIWIIDCNSYCFNPLPDDKILDWSKLKQIADKILTSISNEK